MSVAALGTLGVAACQPDTEGRPSEITSTRLLAVRADPAEAAPGGSVRLSALVAGPSGAVATPELDWGFCVERKPLAAPGMVAPACTRRSVDPQSVLDLGWGPEATGTVPLSACEIFGPKPPPAKAGEPAYRAADPDASGGYFQPIRLAAPAIDDGEPGFGAVRLSCGLGAVTLDQGVEYRSRYHANTHPAVDAVSLVFDGQETTLDPNQPLTVPAGSAIALRARWVDCPMESPCGDGFCGVKETDKSCPADCSPNLGCSGSEAYLYFDPDRRVLREGREALRISWFVTGGTLARDRTGRTADDPATFTENTWTTPALGGSAFLWLVIRDERGGVGWNAFSFQVE